MATRKKVWGWDKLTPNAQDIIVEGARTYHALKTEHRDYMYWKSVCLAVQALRNEALRMAGLALPNDDEPDGPNPLKLPEYQGALDTLLDDPKAGDLKELYRDRKYRTTLSDCYWMADHITHVDEWFAKNNDLRGALSHPSSIRRKHPDGNRRRNPSTVEAAKKRSQRQQQDQRTTEEVREATEALRAERERFEEERAANPVANIDLTVIDDSGHDGVDVFLALYLEKLGREKLLAFLETSIARLKALPPEPEPPKPTPAPKRGRGRNKSEPQPAAPVSEPAPKRPSRRRGKGEADAGTDVIVRNDPQPTVVADKKKRHYSPADLKAMRAQVERHWDQTTDAAPKAIAIASPLGWGDVTQLDDEQYKILVSVARDKMGHSTLSSDVARKLGLMPVIVNTHWN